MFSPQAVPGRGVPCHKRDIEQDRSSRRCLLAYHVQQRTLPFSLPEHTRVSVCRVYCPRMPMHVESLWVQELSLLISDDAAGSRPPPDSHLESRRALLGCLVWTL